MEKALPGTSSKPATEMSESTRCPRLHRQKQAGHVVVAAEHRVHAA